MSHPGLDNTMSKHQKACRLYLSFTVLLPRTIVFPGTKATRIAHAIQKASSPQFIMKHSCFFFKMHNALFNLIIIK